MHKNSTKSEANNVIEILDRVLDHGIVFDPSTRLRLLGLDLLKTHEQVVIDWRNTYF